MQVKVEYHVCVIKLDYPSFAFVMFRAFGIKLEGGCFCPYCCHSINCVFEACLVIYTSIFAVVVDSREYIMAEDVHVSTCLLAGNRSCHLPTGVCSVILQPIKL